MKGFIKSFHPFLKAIKRIKHYRVEALLLFIAFVITIISFVLYNNHQLSEENLNEESQFSLESESLSSKKIFVDIAGAVNNPGVYESTVGSRLKDIVNLAGGISKEADNIFFQRNFNLARIVNDQEKIYIPYAWEINNGIFTENSRILDYTSPQNINQNSFNNINNKKININQASIEELDSLPGIGKVRAQKIIDNRPYQKIEDLLIKKVVNKDTFEKIKDLISL